MSRLTRFTPFLLAAILSAAPAQDIEAQARELVDRVAGQSANFQVTFDAAVQQGIEGGPKIESRARKRSRDFTEAAQKLRSVFQAKKEKNDPAVRGQLEKTLAAAADIQRVVLVNRFTVELRRNWDAIRSDLNSLAQIYSLSPF